jgi:4-diphosphocytidyl-2-C-methyl-D-erythritol kinase
MILDAFKSRDVVKVTRCLFNSLESFCLDNYPEIYEAKKALQVVGSKGTLMSGSGSCVFGIFFDEESQNRAFGRLSKMGFDVYRARPIKRGVFVIRDSCSHI